MSTGKRIAKRSILGTRVACSLEDGKYYPGIICDVKPRENGGPSVYSVRIEGDRRARELREGDLVGSCFTSVNSVKLRGEQKVYITHNNREVQGSVIYHRPHIDEVLISVINPENNQPQDVKKRLEEVRLLESRKSARLADQDTDFAKLADCTSERNYRKSSSSITIDVPNGIANGSRKRRGSRSDEDLTDECAAALVLMKLSCSPRSPVLHEAGMIGASQGDCMSGASSVSSGVWSLKGGLPTSSGVRSATPSPPLSDASPTTDDGIELDDVLCEDVVPRKRRSSTRTMFRCTWKNCVEITSSSFLIENHIRTQHLGRRLVNSDSESDSDDDHEEEFYWTEVEINMATSVDPVIETRDVPSPPIGAIQNMSFIQGGRAQTTSPKPISIPLPPPQRSVAIVTTTPLGMTSPTLNHPQHVSQFYSQTRSPPQQHPINMSSSAISSIVQREQHHTLPFTFVSSPPTLSHMDMVRPPHEDPEYIRQHGITPTGNSPSVLSSSWPKSSSYLMANRGKNRIGPVVKTASSRVKRNGESRKCRKVYGMEQKDQWCTQCKWKKACSRFGE